MEPGSMRETGTLTSRYWDFTVYVVEYSPNTLTLRAEPGGTVGGAGAAGAGTGTVGGAGASYHAGGEVITITATPSTGYFFSGWYSSNGGYFADAGSPVTQFTMPNNPTTVTAYFSYSGLPGGGVGGGGGGVSLPQPVHYFTYGPTYTSSSGVPFGHVTLRSFNLFSRVEVDGRALSRYSHYNVASSDGYTWVTLANGYLDSLGQGPHTLTVYFSDNVTVSAVFTVHVTAWSQSAYNDVFTSDWYYESVMYVTGRGWMSGRASSPQAFAPNSAVTQGEAIDAIYHMAGRPSVLSASGAVLQGRDAAQQWALSMGIVPIGGVFNMASACARQDVVHLIYRMATSQYLRFPIVRDAIYFADEASINAAARTAVTTLYRAGIISGRSSNTFVPLGNMTRAEFAAVLHRFALAVL
jgi:hypothetical protein